MARNLPLALCRQQFWQGCLSKVGVTVRLTNDTEQEVDFNMCRSLGPQWEWFSRAAKQKSRRCGSFVVCSGRLQLAAAVGQCCGGERCTQQQHVARLWDLVVIRFGLIPYSVQGCAVEEEVTGD